MWSTGRSLVEATVGLAGLAHVFAGVSTPQEAFTRFCTIEEIDRAGVVLLSLLVVDALWTIAKEVKAAFGSPNQKKTKTPATGKHGPKKHLAKKAA